MQAIARTVRIGQTQRIKIVTLYITYTVDDTLRQMHNEKVNVVNSVTGDLNINDMYNDMTHVNKFMKTYNATKAHK
jgi:SNF2 family DNA or RNA helicase